MSSGVLFALHQSEQNRCKLEIMMFHKTNVKMHFKLMMLTFHFFCVYFKNTMNKQHNSLNLDAPID